MAIINSKGYAHVRLTVTDIARSKKFYDDVFGWPAQIDMSHEVGEAGTTEDPQRFYGGTVYLTPSGALFGLRPVGGQTFDSTTTGLDHVSFTVDSREDLEEAARGLDELGVSHGDIIDLEGAGLAILSFQDPDDINLELTAPI